MNTFVDGWMDAFVDGWMSVWVDGRAGLVTTPFLV
jgi:hypothetical protein